MSARRFRPTRVAGHVAASVAAMLTCATLAACTGSSGGGSGDSSATIPPTTPTATATRTVSVTPPPSSSSTDTSNGSGGNGSGDSGSGSGSGGSAAAANCRESQLRASLDPRPVGGSSDTGDYAVIVDFENTSSRSCVIRGYPGAALVDDSGKQVKQATRTIRGKLVGLPVGQDDLPSVTLQPGAVASAGIEGVNQQEKGAAQAGCDDSFYPRILVTPPNTKTAVPFTQRWPKCYSFTVHPTNIEKNPPN